MIHLKNNSEIEKLYRAGQVVKNTLFLLEESILPFLFQAKGEPKDPPHPKILIFIEIGHYI